jgi:membrane-associated protease RseP (regulator of RpoE activity)
VILLIGFLLELYAVSFFLAAFFQYEAVLSFALAVAVHECGHILAARALSVEFSRPEFYGTDARIRLRGRQSALQESVIVLAGPLANVFASVAVLLVFGAKFNLFAELSYIMALVNLFPIAHLDGGMLLKLLADALRFKRGGALVDALSVLCILSLSVLASYRMLRYGDSFFTFFSSLYWAMRGSAEKEKRAFRSK